MNILSGTLFAAALVLLPSMANAESAVIYGTSGKFDKSFNEMAYTGAKRWAEETGGSHREFELQSEAQREQALRRLAQAGSNPIIVTGFAFATALKEVAPEYPDTTFVIMDTVVKAPNVRSVVFREHEGSYLVGMIAGLTSKTGTVGFIGGMDIPLIRKFACGYAQGAHAANPDIKVIQNMTGTTPKAWNDPVKGAELTLSQISQGADVVFAAAGGTSVGVLQTAADEGIFSIGVDSNQNYLHPGKVLTSMMKRVDNAVYEAMKAGADIETGTFVMGLANDGVGYAVDEHNAHLITAEIKAAMDDVSAKIVSDDVTVHDYTTDSTCPVE